MKPLIGVTGRQFAYGKVNGAPPVLADRLLDCVLVDYIDAVLASGGIPVHLPMRVDPGDLIGRLDGLVLSGGADVDPFHYGQPAHPDLDTLEPDRDVFELRLADLAIHRSLPTLGICRGNQVLNVVAGGTLSQHVPHHARFDAAADEITHSVKIDIDSIPGRVYGESRPVNSFHHQVIDDVGKNIRVVARDDDGDIEAIEFDGKPIVGIQWHPEMFRTRDPIFDWLVATASNSPAA